MFRFFHQERSSTYEPFGYLLSEEKREGPSAVLSVHSKCPNLVLGFPVTVCTLGSRAESLAAQTQTQTKTTRPEW